MEKKEQLYEGKAKKVFTKKSLKSTKYSVKNKTPTRFYRVPTRDFFGKAVLFKSQAWRDATPFLVLFNFLHLINHQNRVNLLLQLNCR